MTDQRPPPRLFGWVLPSIGTAVGTTVAASLVVYFIAGRAAANLVAIAGAVAVTVVVVVRDRAAR